MVSFCLKSLNKKTLDELEIYFDTIEIPNIFYSQKKFRKFYNFIIHYTGYNTDTFYKEFCNILTKFIIDKYEKNFIKSQLRYDFFYFTASERDEIYKMVKKILQLSMNKSLKEGILHNYLEKFNRETKRYNLDGLINFRIYEYKNFIKSILEKEVHNYVVKKEYSEYVSLLNEYIKYQPTQADTVHLIYNENEKLLLDDSGNLLTTTAEKKYISDISFSTNDFILNSILSLMPEKLIVHSHCEDDNFTQFLKLIFEDKYSSCNNCNLCKTYWKKSENIFSNNKKV